MTFGVQSQHRLNSEKLEFISPSSSARRPPPLPLCSVLLLLDFRRALSVPSLPCKIKRKIVFTKKRRKKKRQKRPFVTEFICTSLINSPDITIIGPSVQGCERHQRCSTAALQRSTPPFAQFHLRKKRGETKEIITTDFKMKFSTANSLSLLPPFSPLFLPSPLSPTHSVSFSVLMLLSSSFISPSLFLFLLYLSLSLSLSLLFLTISLYLSLSLSLPPLSILVPLSSSSYNLLFSLPPLSDLVSLSLFSFL